MRIPDSLNEEAIPVMAKWWADLLRAKHPFDCGGPVPLPGLMQRVTELRQADLKPEHADAFEKTLADEIRAQFPSGFFGFHNGLSVDYHPTALIKRALIAAGVPNADDILPVKVDMHVYSTGITVHGPPVDGGRQTIWRAFDEVDLDKVDIESYERGSSQYRSPLRMFDGELAFIALLPSFQAKRVALILRGVLQTGSLDENNFIGNIWSDFTSLGYQGFMASVRRVPDLSHYPIPGVPPGLPDPWA